LQNKCSVTILVTACLLLVWTYTWFW